MLSAHPVASVGVSGDGNLGSSTAQAQLTGISGHSSLLILLGARPRARLLQPGWVWLQVNCRRGPRARELGKMGPA